MDAMSLQAVNIMLLRPGADVARSLTPSESVLCHTLSHAALSERGIRAHQPPKGAHNFNHATHTPSQAA